MKNRVQKSKSSWFCFRPHTMEESVDTIDSPVYIAVKPQSPEKTFTKEIVLNPEKPSSTSRRRALSGIFKAVLFETVLIKSRKVQQDPCHTSRNLQELRSTNNTTTNKPSKEEDVTSLKNPSKNRKATHQPQQVKKSSKEDDRRISKHPAAITISSSLCSPTSSSPNLTAMSDKALEDAKQSKTKKTAKSRSNSAINGLFLLLISLTMLVFWGRVCAIICTSTWIYFGPSFRHRNEHEVEAEITRKAEEVQEMGSRQYRKRVIMEGLLERTHNRV